MTVELSQDIQELHKEGGEMKLELEFHFQRLYEIIVKRDLMLTYKQSQDACGSTNPSDNLPTVKMNKIQKLYEIQS